MQEGKARYTVGNSVFNDMSETTQQQQLEEVNTIAKLSRINKIDVPNSQNE